MRIKFLCPHCERVCRVPAELAGKQGRCPGCQRGLEVPTESTYQSMQMRQAADEAKRKVSSALEKAQSDQGKVPSAQGKVSGQGEVFGAEGYGEGSSDTRTGALPEMKDCGACAKPIPFEAAQCIHCGVEVGKEPVPLQIKIAIALFLCMPLPGLAMAQWGLMIAHKRNKHVKWAWVAVGLNSVNLIFNLIYFLVKGLNK